MSCKLVDQPPLYILEKQYFAEWQSEYNCTIDRFFSDTYLRYNKEGSYIMQFTITDSSSLKLIDRNSYNMASKIDTTILKNKPEIKEIDFHIRLPQKNNSYEIVRYISFKRNPLQKVQMSVEW